VEVIEKSGVEGGNDERIQLVGKPDEIWRESEMEMQLKGAIERVLVMSTIG
jgi:hypothetical protein